MDLTVSAPRFGGTIRAIASKSSAHRLLICAALSDAPCRMGCSEDSEDIRATVRCLNAMGAAIRPIEGGFAITPIDRSHLPAHAVLDCGESGSTLRFLLPVVCALGLEAELHLHGRLPERPLEPLYSLLCSHGAVLSEPGQAVLHTAGQLKGADFCICGGVSSQYISGLLFTLPLIGGRIKIEGKLESAGYVELTKEALALAGVTVTEQDGWLCAEGSYHLPTDCSAEGDWSNAAFWLCAGAVGAEPVTVTGLTPTSCQPDRAIISLLQRFGAQVAQEESQYTVIPAPLHGIEIDASQMPDLVPILALVAACAEGQTRIFGAERLRIKESDRLATTAETLRTLGVAIAETADGLLIEGSTLHGGGISSHNDHRIAMMAAIAALKAGGEAVTIRGAQAVNKSYPAFFRDYAALGGAITEGKEQV
ncbi:MAG: 3-phosphoshikimate 1-carboxyvinyltransferase [Ruminococcaceae bacterium]|nr:3-phosphoshikimate 1-carboxyvinyltransferase [Oscillospiraceae bacterium]